MNPFHGMEVGEECIGTIALYKLNAKRLIKTGVIRKGTKTVYVESGSHHRRVDVETYFYRGDREFYRSEREPDLEGEA